MTFLCATFASSKAPSRDRPAPLSHPQQSADRRPQTPEKGSKDKELADPPPPLCPLPPSGPRDCPSVLKEPPSQPLKPPIFGRPPQSRTEVRSGSPRPLPKRSRPSPPRRAPRTILRRAKKSRAEKGRKQVRGKERKRRTLIDKSSDVNEAGPPPSCLRPQCRTRRPPPPTPPPPSPPPRLPTTW